MSGGPRVKLTLDIAIGATSKIESEDQGKMADIVQRVKDLNSRLQDIRREQVFQRVYRSLVVHLSCLSLDCIGLWTDRVIHLFRNGKPSSVISPRPPTPVSSVGL